jgi:hypothetical protein
VGGGTEESDKFLLVEYAIGIGVIFSVPFSWGFP